VWQSVRTVAGIVLVVLGFLGLLLPVIPGIPLLVAGVALLGTGHPWVRPFIARLRWWRRWWKKGS
jgi:uncharacterized membrane protein YbaN (DUF454 family)